jgi:hypothetical protein
MDTDFIVRVSVRRENLGGTGTRLILETKEEEGAGTSSS